MRRGPNTAYSSVWQTSAFFVIRLCWVCIYVEKHEHYRRLCMVSTRPFGVGEHVVAISLFHGSVSECSIGCGSESQFCSCCADWLCRIILIVCLTDRFVGDFFAIRSLSASPSSGSVIQGMWWGGSLNLLGRSGGESKSMFYDGVFVVVVACCAAYIVGCFACLTCFYWRVVC